jgi:hypothetical protein
MVLAGRSRPVRSSASGVGTRPMAVSTASPSPFTRSTIHFSTRLLSPKPGQRNLPSAPLRNQFTQNSLGSFDASVFSPICSQCEK